MSEGQLEYVYMLGLRGEYERYFRRALVALLFSAGYGFLLKQYPDNRLTIRWGFATFLLVNIVIVLASNINLPWVSPLEQLQRHAAN